MHITLSLLPIRLTTVAHMHVWEAAMGGSPTHIVCASFGKCGSHIPLVRRVAHCETHFGAFPNEAHGLVHLELHTHVTSMVLRPIIYDL